MQMHNPAIADGWLRLGTAVARQHFSARELVELVTTVSYYNMVARFLEGLQIDLEA